MNPNLPQMKLQLMNLAGCVPFAPATTFIIPAEDEYKLHVNTACAAPAAPIFLFPIVQ